MFENDWWICECMGLKGWFCWKIGIYGCMVKYWWVRFYDMKIGIVNEEVIIL